MASWQGWRGVRPLAALLGLALSVPSALWAETPRFQGELRVLFATNRAETEAADGAGAEPPELEDRFGDRRGPLQFGACTVNFSDIPGVATLSEWLPFYLPPQSREIYAVDKLQAPEFWGQLHDGAAAVDRPLVGYVHGYNIDFSKSCRRTAVFQAMVGLDGNLAMFSWPSSGKVIQYSQDENNIRWSVPHILAFVRELIARSPTGQADLVAHSLGSRGLLEALEQLACQSYAKPPIRQLVLVAPDVDAATGAEQLERIRPLAERVTLYVDGSDKPLRLSRELHGYPRLGESGEFLQPPAGVETIDVSEVAAYELSGHLYHLYLPAAIADIRMLLTTGAGAAERPGLEPRSINGSSYWAIRGQEK